MSGVSGHPEALWLWPCVAATSVDTRHIRVHPSWDLLGGGGDSGGGGGGGGGGSASASPLRGSPGARGAARRKGRHSPARKGAKGLRHDTWWLVCAPVSGRRAWFHVMADPMVADPEHALVHPLAWKRLLRDDDAAGDDHACSGPAAVVTVARSLVWGRRTQDTRAQCYVEGVKGLRGAQQPCPSEWPSQPVTVDTLLHCEADEAATAWRVSRVEVGGDGKGARVLWPTDVPSDDAIVWHGAGPTSGLSWHVVQPPGKEACRDVWHALLEDHVRMVSRGLGGAATAAWGRQRGCILEGWESSAHVHAVVRDAAAEVGAVVWDLPVATLLTWESDVMMQTLDAWMGTRSTCTWALITGVDTSNGVVPGFHSVAPVTLEHCVHASVTAALAALLRVCPPGMCLVLPVRSKASVPSDLCGPRGFGVTFSLDVPLRLRLRNQVVHALCPTGATTDDACEGEQRVEDVVDAMARACDAVQPEHVTAAVLAFRRSGALRRCTLSNVEPVWRACVRAGRSGGEGGFDGIAAESAVCSALQHGLALTPTTSGKGPSRMDSCQAWAGLVCVDAVRRALRRCLVTPLQSPERCARLGVHIPSGVLLYGPPGSGKTSCVRAVLRELGCAHAEASCTQLFSSYLGQTEANIRRVFHRARALAKQGPCILVLDHVEVLGSARAGTTEGAGGGSGVHQRALSTLLNEMDGIGSRRTRHALHPSMRVSQQRAPGSHSQSGAGSVIVLACTSRPWALDAALLRPGRFDRLIRVPCLSASSYATFVATVTGSAAEDEAISSAVAHLPRSGVTTGALATACQQGPPLLNVLASIEAVPQHLYDDFCNHRKDA